MPALSVVLPLYRTRIEVPELVARLVAALESLGQRVEFVFVDDACPERSSEAVPAVPPAPWVELTHRRHPQNMGQQASIRTGLAVASGALVAVMDADLQDAPEDLPVLVARLRARDGRCDLVAAGRSGRYEAVGRQLTGQLYRRIRWRLSGGVIPSDAGLFSVMTRSAAERILGQPAPPDTHLLVAAYRAGLRIETVPVVRHLRAQGRSSYRRRQRLSLAVRSLLVLSRKETIR
jgi:dolichol-phosphate mannosyltransferase